MVAHIVNFKRESEKNVVCKSNWFLGLLMEQDIYHNGVYSTLLLKVRDSGRWGGDKFRSQSNQAKYCMN